MEFPKKLILYIVIGLSLIYLSYKNFSSSVFLKNKDRVNVVFYSKNTNLYSFSNQDVNYLINFPPSIEVLVPGGYGYYKVGGLGKLVSLENKPEILKRTFSAATSSFVDLYFYPRKTEIYYQTDNQNKKISFPSIIEIITAKSNANILDRVIFLSKLFDRNQSNYKIIKLEKTPFDREKFNKDFQGGFYEKYYRNIGENVQIIYNKSYSTAYLISQIIDGVGIRVVDLTRNDNNDRCQVIAKEINIISRNIASYFNCRLDKGEAPLSDIILKLGKLEDDWAIK